MQYADNYCTYTENYNPHTYTFTGPCKITEKLYSVTVKGEELYQYRRGALIQTAFPTLSRDDREFLMSGYSPEGWNRIFGSEEDELETAENTKET